ncbi:MAG TPA: metallophosphoesterase [Acidimicrobiales bacterium]|nr:metallophosphoesterase [Acidimicrobiales bacterium]
MGRQARMVIELTTISDDHAVLHDGVRVVRADGLTPDTAYEIEGVKFRTLPRPAGERLATVATVNDVHFGETTCGDLHGVDLGPILRSAPGEPPYPETMNRAAAAEIALCEPDAVVAKGDLTAHGSEDQLRAFLDCYASVFGDRLWYVKGNHDVVKGEDHTFSAPATIEVALPGVTLAALDTSVPGAAGGALSTDQLEWLDELAARTDAPVLVFGHHHCDLGPPSAGIRLADSERLIEVAARRRAINGYFAGHTHRNRVQRFPATGDVPWAEVSATKDFPGAWAEYRIFEGGILQVLHRISAPDALAWSERTRAMFGGLYPAYSFGQLDERCFPIWPRAAKVPA